MPVKLSILHLKEPVFDGDIHADDSTASSRSSARTPAKTDACVQVPLIDLQPWYSYVLKTEKAQTEDSDTTGIPSKQLPSHEPDQKVTSVLLVEVGKEIMGLYTKTKKGAAPVRLLSWVLACPLAGLYTDKRRRNATRLVCLELACSAAQLQAQPLLAAKWLYLLQRIIPLHQNMRDRRWKALCPCAAGPAQAPGAVDAKPDAPEVVGPDGPITPMLEEFGTPGSEGSGISPAQVCMLMPCPLLHTSQCGDVSRILGHLLVDRDARWWQLGCTTVNVYHLAVH